MATEDEFKNAANRSRSLPNQDNATLLKLYSLYKQASDGDVAGDRPGRFKLRERAKYDAWAERKGMSQDDARTAYVDLVNRLAGG